MDASIYEFRSSSSALLDDRRHMTLDFAASPRKCFYPVSAAAHGDCKVASPDLEAFLLYGGGEQDWADNTTSTPTQILFPKSVTAEEEAYARGFMDSLEELYRRKGVPAVAQSAVSIAVISSDLW